MLTPRPVLPGTAAFDVCVVDALVEEDVPVTEPEEVLEVAELVCDCPDDNEVAELVSPEDSDDDLLDGAEMGMVENDVMGDDSDGTEPEWDGMDTDGSDAVGMLVVEREIGGRLGALTLVASVAAWSEYGESLSCCPTDCVLQSRGEEEHSQVLVSLCA